ncbi:hypothetical protein X011_17725 [Mycobacterium tuberculosis variant microti OV254]|nr:hypothetical protein X011_17725 [Mycobacterium tuberculosis variant microti OV254]
MTAFHAVGCLPGARGQFECKRLERFVQLISQYWNGVLRRLQAEVEGFNSLISHQGEKGRENELSLARVLSNLIPGRYGVGSGLIFDTEGNESSQTDIVLFDAIDEPAILAQTNQILFPIENVRGAIEVKTSVGKDEIEDIGEKVASVRALVSRVGPAPLYTAVGYRVTQSIATIVKHLKSLKTDDGDNRPDIFLVLDPGIIGIRASIASKLGWEVAESDYLIGVAPLQRRDGGVPLVGEYEPAPAGDAPTVVHGGNLFSIHSASDIEFLADSARALLLFSEALVTTLATTDGHRPPGFHYYITPEMRDLLIVS